jgi:NTE family protein
MRRIILFELLFVAGMAAGIGGQQPRRRVGLALGGGAARGIAHVGVLRWLEEHHVPVDAIAGTSMGGLVGGAYATGMSPDELQALVERTEWDEMFGAATYRTRSIRRKEDARAYPSRLEFPIRGRLALPTALNDGQQVDFLLTRIGASYAGLSSFDALPTPFRSVAMDLRTGTAVALDSGSLPVAMRATMSIPGVFPPVQVDSQMLVDGGAVDNIPANVARAMKVNVVVAVDVSSESDSTNVSFSMFEVVSAVSDALVRANTKRGLAAANLVIRPDLRGFSGNDWRRARDLIEVGHRAAERMREHLLPLAVDEATWRAYLDSRLARRVAMPRIDSIRVEHMRPDDARRVRRLLHAYVGQRADPITFERALTRLQGFDDYQPITWDLQRTDAGTELVVRAPLQPAERTLMITVNADSRTSDDYLFQVAGRLRAYDVPFEGDELRLNTVLGTDPSIGAELIHGLWTSRTMQLFVAGTGAAASWQFDSTHNNAIAAQYVQRVAFVQGDVGLAGPLAEIRVGVMAGRLDESARIGNPEQGPSLSGGEAQLRMRGIFDTQNSPMIPSAGVRVVATARHMLAFPDVPATVNGRTDDGLTQAELTASNVWSWRQRAERVFLAGFGGTSFDGAPFLPDRFMLGRPLRLDAFDVGERLGDHYGVLTLGYLHTFARLPQFFGGSVMAGGWIESGSAWNHDSDAHLEVQGAAAVILETLIGPAVMRYSEGGNHHRRFAIGIGRLF